MSINLDFVSGCPLLDNTSKQEFLLKFEPCLLVLDITLSEEAIGVFKISGYILTTIFRERFAWQVNICILYLRKILLQRSSLFRHVGRHSLVGFTDVS